MKDRERQRREFWHGLKLSVGVWRRHPWLPILSTAISAIPALAPNSPSFFWLVLPILLFNVGWVGTERIWYLRAFRGRSLRREEAGRFTKAFFGRFARLGLLLLVPLVPIIPLYYASRSAYILIIQLFWVPLDVALTFVTPALAFTTDSVKRALAIGLRMIRTTWPASAWYVLFPPLALLLLARLAPPSERGIPVRFALAVVTALPYLAFKGATVAFYVRRHVVGDDGAAYLDEGKLSPRS